MAQLYSSGGGVLDAGSYGKVRALTGKFADAVFNAQTYARLRDDVQRDIAVRVFRSRVSETLVECERDFALRAQRLDEESGGIRVGGVPATPRGTDTIVVNLCDIAAVALAAAGLPGMVSRHTMDRLNGAGEWSLCGECGGHGTLVTWSEVPEVATAQLW